MIRVNLGCGMTPTNGWLNFDNSLSLKIAKFPFVFFFLKAFNLLEKSQIANVNFNRVNNIKFADATKKLPFDENMVDVIYTSHMLEHLSRKRAEKFCIEAKRCLVDGGILRIAVPDLRKQVMQYVEHSDADLFLERTHLSYGELSSIKQKLKLLIVGFRHHQWMYDGESLSKLLLNVGFSKVLVLDAGETVIKEHEGLNLFEREDESLYIEAIK